jgi:uncharacterized protein YecT (DUF1311 family)
MNVTRDSRVKRMALALLVAIFGGFVATPVFSQDILFDIAKTQQCLASSDGPDHSRACIGASAEQCMLATPEAGSTYGMGACLDHEYTWWDGQLNEVYRALMQREKRDDLEMRQDGIDAPSKADALLTMQRQWIKFRDATCDYEYSQWGGGTGGGPASVSCALRMTAEQTLYLTNSSQGY